MQNAGTSSLLALLLAAASLYAQSAPSPQMSAGQSIGTTQAVWHMQDTGTTAGLRGIDSVDGTVAWASGTGGTVLRTVDGGQHWTRCATPDADKDGAALDFRGVQAWDAQTAIVMASGPGDKSRLYKTADGCRTWKLLFTNPNAPDGFFDSFHLMREQRALGDDDGFGLILGDSVAGELSIFETRDGGHHWTQLHDPLLSMNGGAFAASNECISQVNATIDFLVNGNGGSHSIRLNYQGAYWMNDGSPVKRSWYKASLPLAAKASSAGAFGLGSHVLIRYRDSRNREVVALRLFLVAVGGDHTKPNDSTGTAAWTSDGGLHWTASSTPPHGYRSAVQWSELLKAWMTVGTNGSDISRDDGRTWQPLDNGNWNALSLPFVVGPQGRIARLNPVAILLSSPKPQ